MFHLELVRWLRIVVLDLYLGLSFMHKLTKVYLLLRCWIFREVEADIGTEGQVGPEAEVGLHLWMTSLRTR